MPYYTEEQIRQARSIDLLTYLQTYEPTELVHVRGNTYCTATHDSLKLSNGKWYWWSRGIGGSTALDYLIKVKGLQFLDAMAVLTENYLDIQLKTPQNFPASGSFPMSQFFALGGQSIGASASVFPMNIKD